MAEGSTGAALGKSHRRKYGSTRQRRSRPRYTPGVTYLKPARQRQNVRRVNRAFQRPQPKRAGTPARYYRGRANADTRAKRRAQDRRDANRAARRANESIRVALALNRGLKRTRRGSFGLTSPAFAGRLARDFFAKPGAVEKANYSGYLDRLWRRAAPLYGRSPRSRPPPYELGLTRAGTVATTRYGRQGKRKVEFGPRLFMGARLRPSEREMVRRNPTAKLARSVPLHEWAHVHQTPGLWADEGLTEGGADIFEIEAARRLGLPKAPQSPRYAPYRRRVRRLRKPAWVMRGQFR